MSLHQRAGNGKAQTAAAAVTSPGLVCPVEAFEYLAQMFGFHTRTRIAYSDLNG